MSEQESIFPKRLRQEREKRNISQTELAKQLGMAYNTISRYESGKIEPYFNTLIKLCDILDVSVDYLAGRVDDFNGIYNPNDYPVSEKKRRKDITSIQKAML